MARSRGALWRGGRQNWADRVPLAGAFSRTSEGPWPQCTAAARLALCCVRAVKSGNCSHREMPVLHIAPS